MSYLPGLGATSSEWQLRNGVAIPLTADQLALFQTIQRQINAINAKDKRPLIAVDGRIGKDTTRALFAVVDKHGKGDLAGGDVTPTFVATKAIEIARELGDLMTRLGAVYVADPKSSSKPSTARPDGSIDNPPDTTNTTTLVIAAIAIGGAFAILSKKRKRR